MNDFPIIDPHQHFWDLSMNKHPWLCGDELVPFRYGDYSVIKRTYLPEDYAHDSRNFNVVKTVHQEAEWDPADPLGETEWVMSVHEKYGRPNAMIGQVWFCNDDIAEVLAGHAAYPLMRSVRQKPAASPTAADFKPGLSGSTADPKFRHGYEHLARHGLHFDVQTPWWHLGEVADLAHDFPETTIILNHTGLPADRSEAGLAGWRAAMETLAAQPNTAVKISGLGVPGERWTAARNHGVVCDAIRIFGVERCMFASNFPVDGVCATFDEIFNGYFEIVADMPVSDRSALFHDNAARYYQPV